MKNFPKLRTLLASCFFVLAIATLVLASSLPAFAQATTGTLRGTVTDPNGGVVAGATVTAKHQSTGVTSPSTTNGEGQYVISNLPPGMYTITVEPTSGFSKKAVTDVNVPIGQTTDLSVALALGSPTETVTVTSTGEEIITRDQAQISTTFETRKIEDLPSNGAGNGLDTLALLAPGVVASRNSGVNTDGVGLSVNGNRGRSNNFQIDGSDNNDLSIGGPSLFVSNQSQVAEYQIITNNFSAQYGRNSGAVVNIVTKTGGNEFHGDLFEYHRDAYNLNSLTNIERRSIPATNPTAAQLHPSRDLYNAFGGTVGGPIWLPKFGEGGKSIWKGKDRAFFFFSYQGIREPASFISRGTTYSILGSEFGRLSATFPGNTAINAITGLSAFAATNVGALTIRDNTTVPVLSSAFNLGTLAAGCPRQILAGSTAPAGCGTYTAYINPATGAPFLTGGPYDTFNLGTATAPLLFQAAFAQRTIGIPFSQNEWSYRITVKATSKDNVDFRHLYQAALNTNNGIQSNGFTYDVPATSKNLGGTWTRQISNSIVNEFKATTQDLRVEFGGANSSYGSFAVPKPADIGSTIANISFGGALVGLRSAVALSTIGHATNIPQGRLVKVYQYADQINWNKGSHNFVLGAEFKHLVNKVPFLPSYQGVYTYATATAVDRLKNNAPSAISLTAGEPVTTYTENDQYYFVQDDFKLRSNLTLNLGVRYEYTGQPINQLHDITLKRESGSPKAIFDPTLPIALRTVPFIKPDKNNWAPRIGFAYTPHWGKKLFGEDATVIRGGFAIAYDPAFYNILLNLQNVAPYSAALSLSSANALVSTTTSPLPLPNNPTGDHIQALASTSGVLPLGKLDPRYLAQTIVSPGFHSPYSEQFSFGIQRQVNRNNVFEVRYVGTQGVGLFQNVNDNFFIRPLTNGFALNKTAAGALQLNNAGPDCTVFAPGGTCVGFPSFAAKLPAGVVAQNCADDLLTLFVNESVCDGRLKRANGITTRDNGAHSTYHSMQTRYSGRFLKNNMSINASYTWSKTIDNASEIFAFADINSPNSQNPFDRGNAEKSISNLHRKHAFSASVIYDVPFFKEQRGLVGHLLGGWQLNGVQVSTSGNPYTPFSNTNVNKYGLGATYLTSGDRPFIGNPKAPEDSVAISAIDAFLVYSGPPVLPTSTVFYNFTNFNKTGLWVPVSPGDVRFIINAPGSAKIFGTPFGSMPRNYLKGPGINQLNMSIFKNTKIGERLKVQFQASAFNVLNHPQPGYGVNAAGYLPTSLAVENAGATNGTSFANKQDIALARRVVQFGLRFIF
jgi:outer membrane receptor protein involved in Fe transport